MTDMTGKTVIVTGATGNLGSAVVTAFAATGANIALVDTNAERTAHLIESLGGDSTRFLGAPADLSSPEAVDGLLQQVQDHFGGIHALAHTVGGFAAGTPTHETGLDVFDKMMLLNARIVYLVAGKVAHHMVQHATPGSLNIVVARVALRGAATMSAYSASKAAALRIVESMALELRDHHIRVNAVSPSIIDTPANRASMPNADFTKWVQPAQIADLMTFLASDAGSAITGAHIEINGQS